MSLNTDHTETVLDGEPLVYVRQITVDDVRDEITQSEINAQLDALGDHAALYAVHNEDGERVAIFSDRDLAFAVSRQNGAHPVSVH
ncbi:DUF1150 family protein [Woodsholea maritima]|uniref:DUF1150 family protein n=1 Tax=Woodsholea maritima TaxID=240237 RepID=UPI0003639926|nr:DUF1150 family protein [Woodsholea maritima]